MKPIPFFKGRGGTNVLLKIGDSVCFVAPDAATASQVADLLGAMHPVLETPCAQPSTKAVILHGHVPDLHRVEIGSLEGRHQFADEADLAEWEARRATQTVQELSKNESRK